MCLSTIAYGMNVDGMAGVVNDDDSVGVRVCACVAVMVWLCALAWGGLKCENCVTYRNFGGCVFLCVQHFVDTTDENSFVQSACVNFVLYMYKFHNIYVNYFDTQRFIEPITQHFAFVFNTCFTTISLFSFVFFLLFAILLTLLCLFVTFHALKRLRKSQIKLTCCVLSLCSCIPHTACEWCNYCAAFVYRMSI